MLPIDSNYMDKEEYLRIENILGKYQCGFRKESRVTDRIFALEIKAESYENNLPPHVMFMELKQEKNKVNRRTH